MQLLPWKTDIQLSQGIIIHKHQQQDGRKIKSTVVGWLDFNGAFNTD